MRHSVYVVDPALASEAVGRWIGSRREPSDPAGWGSANRATEVPDRLSVIRMA